MLSQQPNFPEQEKEILKFWEKEKIFEKSLDKTKKCPRFIFYEGPPFANGLPGIHHLLARAFKDAIIRYKTMRGFFVERKAGWDTHGLPTEIAAEKKLGIKTKSNIEKIGVEKFIQACKESIFTYKKEWEEFTHRIGYWLDFKNAYITCKNDYVESLWWILKKIWEKGLLYEDYKVVPYCPRCGTSLSSHELAQGYKKVKEKSVFLKFKVKNQENTYFLVWTTTPWTLPGNVALAVGENIDYVKVKLSRERKKSGEVNYYYIIISKEIYEKSKDPSHVMYREIGTHLDHSPDLPNNLPDKSDFVEKDTGYDIKDFKGKDLLNLEYEPLYNFMKPDKPAYKVIAGDFITTEEGTGIVHIAPAFGEDDMKAGKENDLPVLMPVDEEGKFKKEITPWAEMAVKNVDGNDANPLIIKDLEKRNLLFNTEMYEHDYPFCWRCNSPLIYFAKNSWFIKMTEVRKQLIENNEKINWIPKHIKKGRFGEWLNEVKDWNLTRERYWGAPLPVWRCDSCKEIKVVESRDELKKCNNKITKLIFVRHGESKKNILNIRSSSIDKYPLTNKGIEESKKIATNFNEKIDIIFSSPTLRTKQTAEILNKKINVEMKFDDLISEYNYGKWENLSRETLLKDNDYQKYKKISFKKERFNFKLGINGESRKEIVERVEKFIKKIIKEHLGKTILLVSHGGINAAIYKILNNCSIDEYFIQEGIDHNIVQDFYINKNRTSLDLHKPNIDQIKFKCEKCGGIMKRVPEVLDCWFDSGAMPFAQQHYPFDNKEKIDKGLSFPADFICEGIDQTRGWFYTLLAISTLLELEPAYKNVISLGLVLDSNGQKMSKSKGNIVKPQEVIDKFGADCARFYFYTVNQAGEPKKFDMKEIQDLSRKFFGTLQNSYTFFETYTKSSKFKVQSSKLPARNASHSDTGGQIKTQNLLDKWIISRLNNLNFQVVKNLDNYDIVSAARLFENFIDDLSNWYIRRSRRRFQKPKNEKGKQEAAQTLHYVFLNLVKLLAPFVPFISETIFQNLLSLRGVQQNDETLSNFLSKNEIAALRSTPLAMTESVHLCDWPKADKNLIDKKLEEQMERIREITAQALALRAENGIKVRQPLNDLRFKIYELKNEKKLLDLIKEEINVKEIIFDKKIKSAIELDTKITPELKEEGIAREITRLIQSGRKKAGFVAQDLILTEIILTKSDSRIKKILEKRKDYIKQETNSCEFKILSKKIEEKIDFEKEFDFEKEKLCLRLKKK